MRKLFTYKMMLFASEGLYFHLNSSIICRMAKAKNKRTLFCIDLHTNDALFFTPTFH